MSKEAMKLVTEFNRYFTSMNGVDVPERVSVPRDEWRAMFAALAAQQEPVYREYQTTDGVWHIFANDEHFKNTSKNGKHPWPVRDLYTSPPAQVAESRKRTWQGLTDEDYRELHLEMGPTYFYQDYGRAIEAKLRSKNEDRN